jgi:hypothetical protein
MSLSLSHLDGNTRSTLNIPYSLHIHCNTNQSFTCKNVNAKHLCQCEQVYNTISGEGGGMNVRLTVGTLEAILCRLKISFYFQH